MSLKVKLTQFPPLTMVTRSGQWPKLSKTTTLLGEVTGKTPGSVLDTSSSEEILGQTQSALETFCIPSNLGGAGGHGKEERHLNCCHHNPDPVNRKKIDSASLQVLLNDSAVHDLQPVPVVNKSLELELRWCTGVYPRSYCHILTVSNCFHELHPHHDHYMISS